MSFLTPAADVVVEAALMAKRAGKARGSRDPLVPAKVKPPAPRDPSVPLSSVVCYTGLMPNGRMYEPIRRVVRPEKGPSYAIVLEPGQMAKLDGYEENVCFHGAAGCSIFPLDKR